MTRIDDHAIRLTWTQGPSEWTAHCGPYRLAVIGSTWQIWADRFFLANGAAVGRREEVMYRAEDYLHRHLRRLTAQLEGAGSLDHLNGTNPQ